MSGQVRNKYRAAPVKTPLRRGSDASSSLDLSDEDGYSAVEDISDTDDEDDEDVNAAEEEHIITQELSQSPRPKEEDEEGDDEEEDDDDDEEEDDEDDEYDEDNDGADLEDDDEDDEDDANSDAAAESVDGSTSWEGFADSGASLQLVPEHDLAEQELITERRVRFDVPESEGDSTDTDEDVDFFPDIFVEQSSLDPSFRREIEHDPDDSSNSGSFWDYHANNESHKTDIDDSDMAAVLQMLEEDDDSTPVATPMTGSQELLTAVSTPVQSTEDDMSLDGYQSDGDTTEEEDPPEQPIRRKTRREPVEELSDSDAVQLIKPRRRGQPRVARFNLDGSGKKPIAVVNPKTGKMMIFTPQRLRKLDLSPESFNFQQYFQHDAQSSPILSNSGNMMMSAMFASNTFGDFMNTQAIGPAEAFFSMTSDTNGLEESEDDDDDDEDEDDEERNLKLEDFIDFDDAHDSSDDEKNGSNWYGDDGLASTPARPTTASSDAASSLLDHFSNANVVGAFRRDQANHQLLSRSKATRDSLAFSGPFMHGTLRGIKAGHLANADVPITPPRKQRRVVELASSPLSAAAQKRKASSEQHHMGHKRQRSIPDVELLRITS